MITTRLLHIFFSTMIILCISIYCSKKQSNTYHVQNKANGDTVSNNTDQDDNDQDTIIDDHTDTSTLSVKNVNEKCSTFQLNENPLQTCVRIAQCDDISEND